MEQHLFPNNASWINASNLNLTGNAYILGNVGIGTTSSVKKLEVRGNMKLSSTNPYINLGAPLLERLEAQ